ncbi:threonine/serine exporter family protein, partial [Staphylococcus warneri]|uniref:threonine/serine exporter family protein n=1 Tax=Staphylococcus warneri TaxID=1292 RepID=UPI003F7AB300
MNHIPKKLRYQHTNTFLTNTLIQFHFHNQSTPPIFTINPPHTNLIKISQPNQISPFITKPPITLQQPKQKLHKIYLPKPRSTLPFEQCPTTIITITFLYFQHPSLIHIFTPLLPPTLPYLLLQILHT